MSKETDVGVCSKCNTAYSALLGHECDILEWETGNVLGITEPSIKEGTKFDTGKLQYSLIPTSATKALAEVLTYGASKYAPNNWQLVQDGEKRYLDALFRHLEAFRSGEVNDEESGLHHLSHALTNVVFLHYLHTKGK